MAKNRGLIGDFRVAIAPSDVMRMMKRHGDELLSNVAILVAIRKRFFTTEIAEKNGIESTRV